MGTDHCISTFKTAKKNYWFYLMFLPVLAFFIIFHYVPMYGVVLAFKDFRYLDGILESQWAGFKHFDRLFASPVFWSVFKNTIIISVLRIVFSFPAPVMLALMLNEIRHVKFKKFTQTVSYLPYFMSWIVLGGIVAEILSPSRGLLNQIITFFGGRSVYFLTEPAYFRSILVITGIWQSVGWDSIIFLAAITSIDMEQYESAYIDGANRWHLTRYITFPSILPVISIMFILNLGQILNAGFDQIFNLYNPSVYSVADILDTYVYRVGIEKLSYSFAAAVGLFKNVIGFALVLGANICVKKLGGEESGLW